MSLSATATSSRSTRWGFFLALALALAQTFALAHEYDHVLGQHDAPCGLHAFADHAGKALTATGHAPLPPAAPSVPIAVTTYGQGTVVASPFQARAPPAHS